MAKEIAAFDADDTLFDENGLVRLFNNTQFGLAHTPEDYLVDGEYWGYWEKVCGVEKEDWYEEYCRYKLTHHPEPIPGAREELERLKDDYYYVLNTSREGDAYEATREALDLHYPGLFSEVHFVNLWDAPTRPTKAEICLAVGARHLIDDSVEHSNLAAEAGIDAMLFGDLGWNRWQPIHHGVTRVRDWRAIGAHLDASR